MPPRSSAGALAGDFAFVLGTYTDSMASMLGEWLVGWGYRKSQAFGTRAKDGALEVSTRPSGAPFRVVQPSVVATAVDQSSSFHCRLTSLTSLSHPLLGVLPGGPTYGVVFRSLLRGSGGASDTHVGAI